MDQKPFGRRVGFDFNAQRPAGVPRTFVAGTADVTDASSIVGAPFVQREFGAASDEEFRDWKRARRQNYQVPWRQLSLMASFCFGAAALVLPDTVSDALDWLLYGLMAASFVAGIRRRRKRA